ncbi:ester cyclase [Amycolatopsis sp. H6(2020)]|nr:ester cyclase [Amycolatopsis sp. H6(2020)]
MATTDHPQNTDATPSMTDVQGFDRGTGTGEPTGPVAHLLRLMKGADDAFNRRDYDDFLDHGHHQDVVVNYIGRPGTVGRAPHRADLEAMVATFPDLRVHNAPYDIQFGQGEWTVAIGRMSGTFTQPMTLPDGTVVEPTNKSFMTLFTTIARWQNDQMLTEYVLWDDQDVMTQIGVTG